jgi:FkbM family methyltransferase
MVSQAPPDRESAQRLSPVRLVSIGLAAALLALVVFAAVTQWRHYQLWLTGKVTAHGSIFYLHPTDRYLTQEILKNGDYEPIETKLVQQILKEGDVFIDVGANIGWYTVICSKLVGETGKVVAFEPDPSNFAMLRKNVEANRLKGVVLEQKGLSSAPGSFKLFLDRKNLGRHSLVLHYDEKDYVDVETVRFDDYWKDQGDIRLVKIDTEGAEGMILAGMMKTLEKHKRLELILEVAPERLEWSGYDADKMLESLYRLGFKASHIDEAGRRIVPMGTPRVKDFNLPKDDPWTNLHLKR